MTRRPTGMRTLSLCTGYGGFELGLRAAGIPTDLVAVADPDPAAAKVLAHHDPAIPNLGDITKQAWTDLGPIDLLCAGYPCQGFSHAGKRKGIEDERFIWPAVAHAIRILRPRRVLLENVAGHRSLGFGRVLADLAAMRYVGSWVSVRASDVGAAHPRERVFILAEPADAEGIGHRNARPAGNRGFPAAAVASGPLLPTPRTSDTNGPGTHGDGGIDLRTAVSLLPSPKATDARHTPSESELRRKSPSLGAVGALLPTPRATDGTKGGPNQRGSSGDLMLPSAVMLLPTPTAVHHARNATANRKAPKSTTWTESWTLADVAHADRWGHYAPAVARWEQILGRPAPEPTEPGREGKPRLAPRFVEWLMGVPDGWVCDVPGLSRNDQLRLLGNGVVPRQAAYAIGSLHNIA